MKEIALIRKLRNKYDGFASPLSKEGRHAEILSHCRNIIEYIGFGSWDTSSKHAADNSMFLVRLSIR